MCCGGGLGGKCGKGVANHYKGENRVDRIRCEHFTRWEG